MSNNVIEPTAVKGGDTVYTFRTLEASDTFLMFKIIGKIGINEFSKAFDNDSTKELIAKIAGGGMPLKNATTVVGVSVFLEIANVVLGNLPKCEREIYQLLSNTSNLSVEEVEHLDFVTFTSMVVDFVCKDEFADFVKVASKFAKLVK